MNHRSRRIAIRRACAALAVALVHASALPVAVAHAAAENEARAGIAERVVEVEAPAPGEEQQWSLELPTPQGDGPRTVYAELRGTTGALFEGAHPAHIAVAVEGQPQRLAAGETVELGVIGAGAPARLTGQVALPRDAGNEYQLVSGTFTMRVSVACEPTSKGDRSCGGDPNGSISETGAHYGWMLCGATAALLLGSLIIVQRRRETGVREGQGGEPW